MTFEDDDMRGTEPLPPIDAAMMVKVCRQFAREYRREYFAGWPPVLMSDLTLMSRLEAAKRLDAKADRFAREIMTGVPNTEDRLKMGGS